MTKIKAGHYESVIDDKKVIISKTKDILEEPWNQWNLTIIGVDDNGQEYFVTTDAFTTKKEAIEEAKRYFKL